MFIDLSKPSTPEMDALLRRAGSADYHTAVAAQRELAMAFGPLLRKGVLNGDIVGPIFTPIGFKPGQAVEFPLDFLEPGTEKDFVAFTIPNVGRMPERHVEGDYVMVPTYDIGASIDWSLKYARDARWDVVGRGMQVLEGMHIRKKNDDCFHTLLAAGANRNLVVYDNAAVAGLFTKRLVALGKTVMRRNAGGNSTSTGRGKMTDLYLSPEALEDVRSWDLTQVDDVTRREIMLAGEDGGLSRIFGVTLHDIDELGIGQDYQKYAEDVLGASLPSDKVEFAVGLDLLNRDSFVHPIREELQIFDDPTFHRQRRQSKYSSEEVGNAVLDGRRVLLLAL